VTNTIPTERIQLITRSQGLIQRLMGRQAVNVETAGQMDHADDSAGLSSLAPIVPEPDSRRILEVAHPDVDWEEPTWIGLHPRAGTRLARRRLRILIAVAVAAGVGLSPWALLLMLPAPWIWLSSHRWARASAMAITPTAVFYRSGWLARSLSVVRYRKGQTVSISTSPFDRRWKMATLSVDTAGARAHGPPRRRALSRHRGRRAVAGVPRREAQPLRLPLVGPSRSADQKSKPSVVSRRKSS
jgi:putative membrane protein